MRSIKLFLFIVLLAIICLGNFIAALNGFRASLHRAEVLLDQQLAEQAKLLNQLLAKSTDIAPDLFTDTNLFQIWQDGQPQYFSHNAPRFPLTDAGAGYHYANFNGVRWRVLLVEPRQHQRILIAQRYDTYVRLVEDILLEAIVPILWIIPLLALLIWLIVGSGLKPLKLLAGLLTKRRTTDFSPIDGSDYPDELVVVVDSINTLFERLQGAFSRENRFSSDAAHELRTPLTNLKLSVHNLSADLQQQGINAYSDTLQGMGESIDNMAHTIEQLLALYRLTPETFVNALNECNVAELVREQIVESYPRFSAKHQHVDFAGDTLTIRGDRFGLSMLLRNLLENASKYTPASGSVSVSLVDNGGHISLIIEDSGPGIPAEEYSRVFDRFYRQGGDRHASKEPGTGLGLSIVEHVVRLHQGTITLQQSAELGGLAVRVDLPKDQVEVKV